MMAVAITPTPQTTARGAGTWSPRGPRRSPCGYLTRPAPPALPLISFSLPRACPLLRLTSLWPTGFLEIPVLFHRLVCLLSTLRFPVKPLSGAEGTLFSIGPLR